MNRDDVLRLAREAGLAQFTPSKVGRPAVWIGELDHLERFTALVAAAEREACAVACESWNTAMSDKLAAAIRARGSSIREAVADPEAATDTQDAS